MSLKKFGIALLGSSAATAFVGYTYADEGTKRSLKFWRHAFPIFLEYRYVQLLNKDLGILNDVEANTRYDILHEKHTEDVKRLTYEMRGFYLKQAQILSTQVIYCIITNSLKLNN
jgi:aarF domain-containing kinase